MTLDNSNEKMYNLHIVVYLWFLHFLGHTQCLPAPPVINGTVSNTIFKSMIWEGYQRLQRFSPGAPFATAFTVVGPGLVSTDPTAFGQMRVSIWDPHNFHFNWVITTLDFGRTWSIPIVIPTPTTLVYRPTTLVSVDDPVTLADAFSLVTRRAPGPWAFAGYMSPSLGMGLGVYYHYVLSRYPVFDLRNSYYVSAHDGTVTWGHDLTSNAADLQFLEAKLTRGNSTGIVTIEA